MSFYSTFNTLSFIFWYFLIDGTSEDTLDFDGSWLFISVVFGDFFKVFEHFFGYVHGFINTIKQFFWDDPWTKSYFVVDIFFNNTRVNKTLNKTLPKTQNMCSIGIKWTPHHFFTSPCQPSSHCVQLNRKNRKSLPVSDTCSIFILLMKIIFAVLLQLFALFHSFLKNVFAQALNLILVIS